MDREPVAWAAGLFEGEGSFGLKSSRYPVASLGMTDEDVVRRFHDVVGVGQVYGPFNHGRQAENPTYKPHWQWQIQSFEGVQFLAGMFWPWLGFRRKEKVTEVLTTYRNHPGTQRFTHPSRRCKVHKDSGIGIWFS